MALHYLDPRTRGQQAPDVRTACYGQRSYAYVNFGCNRFEGPTEAAALAAAREAAGLSHVAEEPCDLWTCPRHGPAEHCKCTLNCSGCGWPKSAHRTEEIIGE